ncbi:MAG TPA: response regulator, partial [Candidatus Bathyarchaeia archaeon]|nr:response regulator [Candidatus Bathyarchaeia archaeon]
MKKKILVVDDEPDILQVITFRLDKAGYEVTGVSNGEEALRIIGKDRQDLILLDVMMPGLD